MIYSIDCNKGHKYLGMLFYPTSDLDTIILNNISKWKVNVAKYYAWLEINDNTPVGVKLLVLDQCMFTSLLYGAEAWGDISIIEDEIRKIEIKALKSIMKVKQSTSNDLIFFELGRANIISRIKDLQSKFYNKISKLQHDQAIVKYIVYALTKI